MSSYLPIATTPGGRSDGPGSGGGHRPGIGGTFTRFGYTEVLYVTELVGLILIWIGYRYNVQPGPRGAPEAKLSASTRA